MRSLFGPLPLRAVLTVVIGCLLLGLFFGWNAGAAYRLTAYVLWEPLDGPRNFTIPDLGSTGGILGASGGLAVGLIWCRLMGRARGQSTPQRSTLRGALLGGGLGVLCTVWLHAGLIVALVMDPDRPHKELDMLPLVLGIGLACGAISGGILGAIGAALARRTEDPDLAAGATPQPCRSRRTLEFVRQRPGLVAVMLAAGGLSGFMGFVAGLPYGDSVPGAIVGSTAGVVGGAWWVRRFVPVLRSGRLRHPASRGGLYGMRAGVVATLALHGSLAAINQRLDGNWLLIGVVVGAISGFILGEICTRLAGWFTNDSTDAGSRWRRLLLSARSLLSIARMFARMAGRVPASHLLYLLRRMRFEKPHRFAVRRPGSRPLVQTRINTFFPPYPSPAFDRFCRAVIARRRVPYSVYLAATGACPFRCGHCSYAGREPEEMSGERMRSVIDQVRQLGTATLGFTGGEPLLRSDLEELIAAAGPEMATIVFTTGHRLDRERAERLARAGVGCVTIGIEAADAAAHDAVRGCPGSFEEAAAAARACREAGLYLAISTIATRERLASGALEAMYDLGREWDAGEFRILSPVATGAWRGCGSLMLSPEERSRLIAFHMEHNRRCEGPAVNTFAYLESDALFGCGAGYHHLFIDAAGNVCPCDLTPLSFGNLADEPLAEIWRRMGEHFPRPRCGCLMAEVGPRMTTDAGVLPLPPDRSMCLCHPPAPDAPLPDGYRRLLRR